MKAYCLDTCGLSTPLEHMPEDIHRALWQRVARVVVDGKFAVTVEIFGELVRLPGAIGRCIAESKHSMQLEVGESTWDWETYLDHVERMRNAYRSAISEYNGGRKNTVGFNDLSIIALARTLNLPLISSERPTASAQDSSKRLKIPDVCRREDVAHMNFNDFLRAEGISF